MLWTYVEINPTKVCSIYAANFYWKTLKKDISQCDWIEKSQFHKLRFLLIWLADIIQFQQRLVKWAPNICGKKIDEE